MSHFFKDKTDTQITEILKQLKRINELLCKTDRMIQPTLNNERFLTDEELSKILRVSRRTLQEYRSAGTIPYCLVQGIRNRKDTQRFTQTLRRRAALGMIYKQQQQSIWVVAVVFFTDFFVSIFYIVQTPVLHRKVPPSCQQ